MIALIPGTILRAYDIRGLVGSELTPEVARRLGWGFASRLTGGNATWPPPLVIVGYDNRASSPELARAFASGLLESACTPVDVGLATTPMVYFAQRHLRAAGAVAVTASHNPPEFNGFKLVAGEQALHGQAILELGRQAALAPDSPAGVGTGHSVPAADVKPAYESELLDRIRLRTRRRVVVDCGSGTASVIAPRVLAAWGLEVIPLYCTLDSSFPYHHPDPSQAANLADLRRMVRDTRADVGLAFDGDGDRLGVVADDGRIVGGDQLLILFWREVLKARSGIPAPIEVKCSRAVVDEVRRLGGRPQFCPTGHSLVKARLRETGAPFAGELSGHFFFADEYYGFDDALYAAGRLLRILDRSGLPLSQLLNDVPTLPCTPEVRVPCDDSEKWRVVAAVRTWFMRRGESVVTVDGARVEFSDGWALVRASNTQPSLVLRCEGTSEAALARIQAEMARALHQVRVSVDWDRN